MFDVRFFYFNKKHRFVLSLVVGTGNSEYLDNYIADCCRAHIQKLIKERLCVLT
jgi:hypothetical protein